MNSMHTVGTESPAETLLPPGPAVLKELFKIICNGTLKDSGSFDYSFQWETRKLFVTGLKRFLMTIIVMMEKQSRDWGQSSDNFSIIVRIVIRNQHIVIRNQHDDGLFNPSSC
jgi:hypothetical protein